jgi:ribonuclease BN (tRNA processing enzyme)
VLVDCGASSLVALKAQCLDLNSVDGVMLSHLHGDHFGALPFLLLDAQFVAQRERPLLIAGGTRARIDAALEVSFPKSTANKWRFAWTVMEIKIGRPTDMLGHSLTTTEVVHYSGTPATAVRLSDDDTSFAYSGDTEWTEGLVSVANGADLFMIECFAYSGHIAGRLTWKVLKPRLPDLRARRIMLTHMGTDHARPPGRSSGCRRTRCRRRCCHRILARNFRRKIGPGAEGTAVSNPLHCAV